MTPSSPESTLRFTTRSSPMSTGPRYEKRISIGSAKMAPYQLLLVRLSMSQQTLMYELLNGMVEKFAMHFKQQLR
jgi:hypothetical protein